jgi:predicted ATPase/DNA-binding winged helix-turn-helix (wHTH) protein
LQPDKVRVTQPPVVPSDQEITFGTFRFLRAQKLLLEGEKEVPLGSRAQAILAALVERAGEIVSKDELVAKVWPDVFVEESNLRVHINALRRGLRDGHGGARYIATIPGRGYSFVAPVASSPASQPSDQQSAFPPDTYRSPLPAVTGAVGREDIVASLIRQMPERRFVTLVGPGGIGKTTVAAIAANSMLSNYRHGVAFVDLVPISDPAKVPATLASVLGLPIRSETTGSSIIAFLRTRELLLVLDNCEHVIETAATLAELVFRNAPGVHILATSREPLRVTGERVHRLRPLESAPVSAKLTAAEALMFPGIQLFVDRATAVSDDFDLTDEDAPIVADICRRLDGIPLAIELAAGRIDAFGVHGLAERLDDRFRLLTTGRRTAVPRHQTLGATLDWSYELLPASEQTALRSLSVFVGEFWLDSAAAIAGEPSLSEFPDTMANLVTKSLAAVDLRADPPNYRLLDTTRIYCLEKLTKANEREEVARRHAEYYGALFDRALAECETLPKDVWLARYARQIDNLRAALDWAFSPQGDVELGVTLTTGAVPLWVQLSLVGECRRYVERALASAPGTTNPRYRMPLSAALGWSLTFGAGTAPEIQRIWTTTRELAERLGDMNYRLAALWGLWVDRLNHGAFREAHDIARQFSTIVEGSPDSFDLIMADRLLGTSLHYLGEQQEARIHFARMFDRGAGLTNQTRITRFQFDQGVTTRYFQARVLWLLGFPEQAMAAANANVEEARTKGPALSLGSALGQGACPIALFTGDFDAADRFGAMLLEHSERHALHLWNDWARCFLALVKVKRGDMGAGLPALRAELDKIGEGIILPRYLLLLGELAVCLGHAGETTLALQAVDKTLERCERNEELWSIAELYRVKGELIVLKGGEGAEECVRRSLDWAQRQGALSWELRAAISLARMHRGRKQARESSTLLSQVYQRFSEGFDTDDLKTARCLTAEPQARKPDVAFPGRRRS